MCNAHDETRATFLLVVGPLGSKHVWSQKNFFIKYMWKKFEIKLLKFSII